MIYSEKYLENMENALDKAKSEVLEKHLIKLVGTFNKFTSSVNKFFLTLISEKIIVEDLYKDEYNFTKLDSPDKDEIVNNEDEYIISMRMTYYNSLLNYIKDNNILNLETLTPKKIGKIELLISFLDWDRIFDPQPVEINTEALNKAIFVYQKNRGQNYILSSLKASTSDIFNCSKDFFEDIQPIKLLINESYKLLIRKNIIPGLKLPPELQGPNFKTAHDLVTTNIKENGLPVYIELIGELLKEDFTSEGDNIKKIINQRLEDIYIHKIKKEKVKKNLTLKEILLNSIGELYVIPTQIDSILEKQLSNSELFRVENFSIIEKLIDYLKYSLFGNQRNTLYKISITEVDSSIKTKTLDFEKFISSIIYLKRNLTQMSNPESSDFKELKDKEIELIVKEVHSIISKCRYSHKILSSLDDFFKKETTSPKGIQVELKVFLQGIDKAQNLYFEYMKQKEDSESKSTYKPDINPII
ncbi:MAG: hypothetical protein JXR64_02380 [Spirochaetales bacterium]|nr:hypothetical protein [Spirochaetales bacterium]